MKHRLRTTEAQKQASDITEHCKLMKSITKFFICTSHKQNVVRESNKNYKTEINKKTRKYQEAEMILGGGGEEGEATDLIRNNKDHKQ